MEVLILTSGYPSDVNLYNCSWAHSRSLGYLEQGIKPIVINFGAKKSYIFDGVEVYSEYDVKKIDFNKINFLISHSPNIRKHIPFIKKYSDKFEKIFLFFHGSESMYLNYDYPKPYKFMSDGLIKYWIRNFYDFMKMKILKNFIKNQKKIELIFVSNWMKSTFEKNVLKLNSIKNLHHVINNNIHPIYLKKKYELKNEKIADFITIRRFDESKYCVDLVVQQAVANPQYSYHLYGKGQYFNEFKKPDNLTVFNNFISPNEIPNLLNQYRVAIMPTRCDAQGVMMCEMATYGIPVITSNIDVTHEMLDDFKNVYFFDEEDFTKKINIENFKSHYNPDNKFQNSNTIYKEVQLILGNTNV